VLHAERLAGALASTALGDNRPAPVPDSAALATLVASARADLASHGCTRATGRPIPGVNAFSAPVFNHAGDAVLAITLLGHQDHVSAAWSSPMAAALKQAAAAISASLGHRPG
jgi:DNA-binding IclR family transcriptional regulator